MVRRDLIVGMIDDVESGFPGGAMPTRAVTWLSEPMWRSSCADGAGRASPDRHALHLKCLVPRSTLTR